MFARRWVCTAFLVTVACVGDRNPTAVKPRAATPALNEPGLRWVLAYAGAPSGLIYRITQFQRLVTELDTTGSRPVSWMFGGAIFLNLYAASGRYFATWMGGVPADGGDWTEYLDSLFVPGGALSRLDSAVTLQSVPLGPRTAPFRVSIMIPYPDPAAGGVTFAGTTYDFGGTAGRTAAAAAYVGDVIRRFRSAGFRQLQLDGFYWLFEEAPVSDFDVIRQVAANVHTSGLRLLWIPFYAALNWDRWQDLGFDAAWLQPNYFFDPGLPTTRLDSAATRAENNGMGMEIEFDGRMFVDSQYTGRLAPYLSTLTVQAALRAREIAVYDGPGAILRLTWPRQPSEAVLYRRLAAVLR